MLTRSVESIEGRGLPQGIGGPALPGEVLVSADLDLQEAPVATVIFPGTLSYGDYHDAGGVFNEGHYDEFVRAGIDGLNGHGDFQPVHLSQARSLAREVKLTPGQEHVVAAFYAVLMEADTRAPSLDSWTGANADQIKFAEALRVTHGGEVFNAFTNSYPNIWKVKKEEEATPIYAPRSTILAVDRSSVE
ncbi:MAG: hypothetical protein HY430_03065 [Candidatus Levybacteria bacterium]|nr:hypothetical protein [Candidatus Levybacteria bacterium]